MLTDSLGEEREVFGFDETPWLKVELRDNDEEITGWWKSTPGSKNVIFKDGLTGGTTVSYSLSEWGWPETQALGRYNVHLNGYGTRHLTVTPEPISSLLFLTGAGALSFFGYRKKKRIAA